MNSQNPAWEPESVIEWLIAEGRFDDDVSAIAAGLGQRIHDAGAPLWRFRLGMRTLHPLIAAVGGIWERDGAEVQQAPVTHGLDSRPSYIGSPMQIIASTGQTFRRRLTEPLGNDDHLVLHELRDRGATDYFGVPLVFSTGGGGLAIFTTDRAGGFSDYDLAGFRHIVDVLQLIAEIQYKNRVSIAVAESYLGPRTGRRVLDGRITRGHVETIQAAILVSDIRNWTGLSSRLPPDQMLSLVNRYFEIMAGAIEDHGGEIIKFIGDSVLAIFEVDGDEQSARQVCDQAVAAARRAVARNDDGGSGALKFGIGLHFGSVIYGNIGAETRIDFTVLGQPVNVAVRIEGLCGARRHPVLYSAEIANRLSSPSLLIGSETLKGHDDDFDIYAPDPQGMLE
ncbi:MAG: adenylate/guanylate cyclase domain-containing protein [Pseudomonadota bacterium]